MITQKEKEILRKLAFSQREIAESARMSKLMSDWKKHGSFASDRRPMVTIELWTFSQDIIPPMMKCENEEARAIEWQLRSNLANHMLFEDDSIVRPYWPVGVPSTFVPFGIEVKTEHANDSTGGDLGHHFISVIHDLADDFHLLKPSVMSVNHEAVKTEEARLFDLFGDILPTKRTGSSINLSPMQNIVHIMSMEDMYMAMYDYPDEFHQMMQMQTDDMMRYLDLLEAEGALFPTTAEQHLCQGSYCFTDALPSDKEHVKVSDVWGYLDSQETSSISPDMFKEFVWPYYKKLGDRFGRLSYGCCEPVHPLFDSCLHEFENLGKISISPWCDEAFMGERLRGKQIVYLRKPSPNLIGVQSELDEDAVRAHFKQTAQAACGCTLEFAQRDVYHIHNTPDKVKRYVSLIREAYETWWRP